MKTMLIIKGAYYYDGDSILIPHFTGEYCVVDCTQYILKSEWNDMYDDDFKKDYEEDTVEYDGDTYYYAEYSAFNVHDKWKLISDLSDLLHNEENFDF